MLERTRQKVGIEVFFRGFLKHLRDTRSLGLLFFVRVCVGRCLLGISEVVGIFFCSFISAVLHSLYFVESARDSKSRALLFSPPVVRLSVSSKVRSGPFRGLPCSVDIDNVDGDGQSRSRLSFIAATPVR